MTLSKNLKKIDHNLNMGLLVIMNLPLFPVLKYIFFLETFVLNFFEREEAKLKNKLVKDMDQKISDDTNKGPLE